MKQKDLIYLLITIKARKYLRMKEMKKKREPKKQPSKILKNTKPKKKHILIF
jgi:hypothetical protein